MTRGLMTEACLDVWHSDDFFFSGKGSRPWLFVYLVSSKALIDRSFDINMSMNLARAMTWRMGDRQLQDISKCDAIFLIQNGEEELL